jgi:hypothetical protein
MSGNEKGISVTGDKDRLFRAYRPLEKTSGGELSHLSETKQGLAASHEDQFRLLVEAD